MEKKFNGNKIKQIRKKLGLNQTEFGARIELNQSQIGDIETGITIFRPSIAKLVSLEFGVNMDWLLTGEGEMFKARSVAPESVAPESVALEELKVVSKERIEAGVCQACGQAFGLDRELQAKQESLEMAKATIRDKERLLGLQESEIGRLKEEMAVLEQFEQDRSA